MSYLTFIEAPWEDRPRKTKRWLVSGPSLLLGTIKWWPRWRQYCFFPNKDTLFNRDCLREIADFCEEQTKGHNANKQ